MRGVLADCWSEVFLGPEWHWDCLRKVALQVLMRGRFLRSGGWVALKCANPVPDSAGRETSWRPHDGLLHSSCTGTLDDVSKGVTLDIGNRAVPADGVVLLIKSVRSVGHSLHRLAVPDPLAAPVCRLAPLQFRV